MTGQRQYQVFFSYSQSNENPYLVQFRNELSEMVSTRCGLNREDVLFVDTEALRTGAHWETNIRDALQSTRVLVALWSPHYFSSEWCGRECGGHWPAPTTAGGRYPGPVDSDVDGGSATCL